MTVRSMFKEVPELPTVRWATSAQPLASIRKARSEPIVQRPLHLGELVSFGACGNADYYLFGDDWHVAEAQFRWAKRMVGRLAFNALFEGAVTLVVRLQNMVERPWNDLHLTVTLNGELLVIQRRTEQPEIVEMRVRNLLKPTNLTNTLMFYSRLAIVQEIIGGSDMRAIGVGLKDLHFVRDA